MAADRLQRVSAIYHAVLARDTGDRDAFLREACAGDEALRREVESLLAHEDAAARLIETPMRVVACAVCTTMLTRLTVAMRREVA